MSGRGLELLVVHRLIGRAEEDGPARQLADAGAGSERLIVDADVRVQLVVLGEPLRVDRIRERRAGAVDLGAAAGRCRRRCARSQAAVAHPPEHPATSAVPTPSRQASRSCQHHGQAAFVVAVTLLDLDLLQRLQLHVDELCGSGA